MSPRSGQQRRNREVSEGTCPQGFPVLLRKCLKVLTQLRRVGPWQIDPRLVGVWGRKSLRRVLSMWGWCHKMVGLRAGQGDLEREAESANKRRHQRWEWAGGEMRNEVEEGGCPSKNLVNQTQGSGLQVTFSVDAIPY